MRLFKIYAISLHAMVFLSLSDGQLTDPFSVMVGDEICFEGYIMDNFCIERGTLLDNPDVITLEGPDQHSVHCLVDVPACYQSNYEILMEPGDGNYFFIRAYQFDDDNGKQDLIDAARRVGQCSTCEDGGSLDKGFRAEIRGTVVTARSSDVPAMVRLQSIQPSNSLDTFCATVMEQRPTNTPSQQKQTYTSIPTGTPSQQTQMGPTNSVAPTPQLQMGPSNTKAPSEAPTLQKQMDPNNTRAPSEQEQEETTEPETEENESEEDDEEKDDESENLESEDDEEDNQSQDTDESEQKSENSDESEEASDTTVKVLSALSVVAMGILLALSITKPVAKPPT